MLCEELFLDSNVHQRIHELPDSLEQWLFDGERPELFREILPVFAPPRERMERDVKLWMESGFEDFLHSALDSP